MEREDWEDEWEEEQIRGDMEAIQQSLSVFRFFFRFEPQVVLPAPPPENEEEEWNGLHLTAKVWFELDA